MERLNYHHLLYFWMVAREGTVARAAAQLRLAQPTLSGQIHALEGALSERLFERAGRGLRLTEMGRLVFRYADEIFALGREFQDAVKGRPVGRPLRLLDPRPELGEAPGAVRDREGWSHDPGVGVPEVDDVLRLGHVEAHQEPGPVAPQGRLQLPEPLDTACIVTHGWHGVFPPLR